MLPLMSELSLWGADKAERSGACHKKSREIRYSFQAFEDCSI